jgi:CDP-paratose 2-epimerase
LTTSVTDPRQDFEIYALGTFNLLEAVRAEGLDALILFSSTNKVYGALSHLRVEETETRYRYADLPQGVGEATPLDFYSPYGCSKGTADQYVHDYGRTYGLRTVVFRNSCIYGIRQFGIEDQGWLAWFVIAAAIYGDGKQVRDVLFVDDLVDVMLRAAARPEVAAGQVYNIGGGPDRTVSVWKEFGPQLESHFGRAIPVTFHDWRPGKVDVADGIGCLHAWVQENRSLFDR